jgi:hypothetical protein
MLTFEQLTVEQKREIRVKARAYYDAHKPHVISMYLSKKTVGIAPSGSDMFRPELWKGIHWRWFQLTFKEFENQLATTQPKEFMKEWHRKVLLAAIWSIPGIFMAYCNEGLMAFLAGTVVGMYIQEAIDEYIDSKRVRIKNEKE